MGSAERMRFRKCIVKSLSEREVVENVWVRLVESIETSRRARVCEGTYGGEREARSVEGGVILTTRSSELVSNSRAAASCT